MASDPTIKVRIETDATQATSGMEKAASQAESFGSRFKAVFAGVLSADVIQKVAGKVYEFGKQSVEAYESAEATSIKFQDALSKIPGASKKTTDALTDQAKALSQVTVYSAGQSKQAIASLASFGLTGDQLKTLLPLVQDYAAKTGQDLPTAAGQVGKALLGQGRALKGIGIDFKNQGSVAANFAEITDGLKSKVGGLADEMGGTSAGKMKIMENNITALKVKLGGALVPAIESTMKVLQPFMTFIGNNAKWLVPLAAGLIAVAGGFIFLNFAVGLFMANPPVLLLLAIAAAIVGIVAVVILLARYWDTIWHGILSLIQVVWNWIKSNWPLLLDILFGPFGFIVGWVIQNFGLIVGALLAVWNWIAGAWSAVYGFLSAPIIAAYNWIVGVIQGIPGVFSAVVGWIAGVWSTVYNAVVTPITNAASWIWGKIQAIGGWFAGIAGSIAGALSGVFDAIIGPFKKAWDWINNNVIGPIKSGWNAIAHAINAVHLDVHIPSNPITKFLHVDGLGFSWDPPKVPTLARGGLMTGSGLVYAHAGEVISPAPTSVTSRNGPAIVINTANFSEEVDVESFLRRASWVIQTQRI